MRRVGRPTAGDELRKVMTILLDAMAGSEAPIRLANRGISATIALTAVHQFLILRSEYPESITPVSFRLEDWLAQEV